MDILDILLDILLKPPQPFIGLFLRIAPQISKVFLITHLKSMSKTSIIKNFIFIANIVTMAQMKNIFWPTTMGMFTSSQTWG